MHLMLTTSTADGTCHQNRMPASGTLLTSSSTLVLQLCTSSATNISPLQHCGALCKCSTPYLAGTAMFQLTLSTFYHDCMFDLLVPQQCLSQGLINDRQPVDQPQAGSFQRNGLVSILRGTFPAGCRLFGGNPTPPRTRDLCYL